MKCQPSICTVAFLCRSPDTLFSAGKTPLEPRDPSYVVINAMMEMKIAVVANPKNDKGERVNPGGGRRVVRWPPSESLEQICFTPDTWSFFRGGHHSNKNKRGGGHGFSHQ